MLKTYYSTSKHLIWKKHRQKIIQYLAVSNLFYANQHCARSAWFCCGASHITKCYFWLSHFFMLFFPTLAYLAWFGRTCLVYWLLTFMFTVFSRASRTPQQRRFVTKGVFTLRTFVGLTVYMTVHVSRTMGLMYECFMAISTRKVRFGLVFSNHNCVVAGISQCRIQKNTDHILFYLSSCLFSICCFK